MGCCQSVPQSKVGVFESCGRFNGIAPPGCHCFLCWTSIVTEISVRLQEYEVMIESKTKDNVFVLVQLVVQYQIDPDCVQDAYYKASEPLAVLRDHVMNSIRAKIPLYKLEALFLERGTISQQLKEEIDQAVGDYGIEIVSALIADIDPGPEITQAMNDVQRLQRLRVASVDEAETKKMRRVRAAEALCDARRLSGEGLAEQRKAIVAGLMESIETVRSDVPDLTADDATNMLLINQYYDTLQDVARGSQGSVMMIETTGGLERVALQLREGVTGLMRPDKKGAMPARKET